LSVTEKWSERLVSSCALPAFIALFARCSLHFEPDMDQTATLKIRRKIKVKAVFIAIATNVRDHTFGPTIPLAGSNHKTSIHLFPNKTRQLKATTALEL
jgi:hypothetical protein